MIHGVASVHGGAVFAQSIDSTTDSIEWIILGFVFLLIVGSIGTSITSKQDRSWLPGLVLGAFTAKMLASLGRYYMVSGIYGRGDSFNYHEQGLLFAPMWRALVVPISRAGAEGTAFTEVITGLLYAPYRPSMVGGFLIFAFLAFVGQLLFYAAFRPWLPRERLKVYAMTVLLLPSLLFWPSSIGKDALMVLFLGVATYGASRLLLEYRFSSLLIIAPGLYLAARIRPHVAGIWVIALVLAALFAKPPAKLRSSPKRAVMIGISMLGVVFALVTFSSAFEVSIEQSPTTQSPQAFLEEVSEATRAGRSAIEGGAVASPIQLPGAVVKVLFRPLIHEATNLQVILSALEGTVLLAIVVWKLPVTWRNKWVLRENPMMMMAFLYTVGFVVPFSAINNLGILARQRVQVLPMFLAWLVVLSWDGHEKPRRRRPSDKIGRVEDETLPAEKT